MSEYMQWLRGRVGSQLVQMPAVSVVIRDEAGRILLVQDAYSGAWLIPGGAIEPGETPAEAAVREILEETGLRIEPLRVLGVFGGPEFVVSYPNGDRTSYVSVVFEARVVSGELVPDGEEVLEAGYFTRDQLEGMRPPAWMAEVLDSAFAGGEAARFRAFPPGSPT
jgi:ADP-ribose pyrophosphatase YjhB (NUDIX family)